MSTAATCRRFVVAAALAACVTGCSTSSLRQARSEFYSGRFDQAVKTLTSGDVAPQDKVLVLMERGTIRQAKGDYAGSSRDFIDAATEIERLQTYSVSKGGASMVVNDSVQSYKGAHFERALLHALTANNHLAQGNWENAAVEARRIIETMLPEARGDYPEDAYSRYMAGFCLEMTGDPSNAALQYRLADKLCSAATIDERTGWLDARPPVIAATNAVEEVPPPPTPPGRPKPAAELACFVMLGRATSGTQAYYGQQSYAYSPGLYAEISANGRVLGRSFPLADTTSLASLTRQKDALRKTAKTVVRVATKETIAHELERKEPLLGFLARVILIGLLERPDVRCWETLPRWLEVARVPCPPDLKEFDVTLKTAYGATVKTLHVKQPLQRNGPVFVSFCRDL